MTSIKDVARRAGVAVSTVSKVVNGYPNVSEETRQKVNGAVRELNFTPNAIASALSSKRASRVALLINQSTQSVDEVAMQYLSGAINRAQEEKLDVITVFFSMIRDRGVEEITRYFQAQSIEGLLIYGMGRDDGVLHELIGAQQFKVVAVDAPFVNENTSCVGIDHAQAQYDVAKKTLRENRGKAVLYIAGKKDGYVTRERLAGMWRLAQEEGLSLTVHRGDFSEKKARELTFSYAKEADMIVCASDLMAIGAMRALQEMDIFRPVCGFDGITLMGYAGKQMNTVKQDFRRVSAVAMEEMARLLEGGTGRRLTPGYELVRMQYLDIINERTAHAECAKTEVDMAVMDTIQREIIEEKMEQEMVSLAEKLFGKTLEECSDKELYGVLLGLVKNMMHNTIPISGNKRVYYISAEFLIGKLLSNNLINLGIYEKVDSILKEHGKELSKVEDAEPEPSLGNGGLGRLAACFLDSIATLGLPGEGIGLNYHFGLFHQKFVDRLQTAEKDTWIEKDSWLTRTDTSFDVYFGDTKVVSRLYDVDVIGYEGGVNKLRLFDLESVDEGLVKKGITFDKEAIEKNLTLFLYPDDSDEAGNLLRIYQQYFMVSNAAQLILKEMKEKQYDLHALDEHAVIQINDTHPSMIIPELIRILVEDKAFTMDEAIGVVSRTCAYTNHTILAEALEKWPLEYLEKAVPQLVPIIKELDKRIQEKYEDPKVWIIDENDRVHMAHMDIHYGFSVNGVAAIHTQILQDTELNSFYKLYPEKFNNKTNGITFRRWLLSCNRELAALISETIGDGYKKNADELEKLLAYAQDQEFLEKLAAIKTDDKKELAAYIKEKEGVEIDPNSIYDIQIKRLHEYKRQQMNALYIIHKYLEIKKGKKPSVPVTFIFGAKAAPAYIIAQDIIHLLLVLQDIVNNDPDVSPYMKVVMVENYNVSYAEKLIPACDISEQISLASKEASGTGNMKFMLNGAVTLGTADGANVEIHDLVGDENIYIFGKDSETVIEHYEKADYVSKDYYKKSPVIKEAVDFIVGKQALASGHKENLERLYKELLNKDWFMTLLDLEEYIEVKDRMLEDYRDRESWQKKVLVNIAKAGFFSSDRTIREYNRDIWKL